MICGLAWWGVTPEDMARRANAAQYRVKPFTIWDIQDPIQRRIMGRRPFVSLPDLRLVRAVREEPPNWICTTSPHRLGKAAYRAAKEAGTYLIALLSDRPTGIRGLEPSTWQYFDLLASPEDSWLNDVPPVPGQRRVQEGWGSTLTDAALIRAEAYVPQALMIVGAAYPERQELARDLARTMPILVQGPGWRSEGNITAGPAQGRLATLTALRRNRAAVLNIQHTQFATGHNPQYFDYAASAIPQVLGRPGTETLEHPHFEEPIRKASLPEVLRSNLLLSATGRAAVAVRSGHMFNHTLQRLIP